MEDAIKENNQQKFLNLLNGSAPIDVNIRNKQNQTGAIIACRKNALKVLKVLAKQDTVDLSARDISGFCAIHYAAQEGHAGCVEELLRHNSQLRYLETPDRLTPAHLACVSGDLKTAKLLVSPTDLNSICTSTGDTLLHFAVRGVIKHRTKAGGFIDPSNVPRSCQELVNFILDLCGEEAEMGLLFARNNKGNTALFEAIMVGNLPTCKLLVSRMRDIADIRNSHYDTALHIAARYNRLDILTFLLDNCNIDVNATTRAKYTPLHEAAMVGNMEMVKILTQAGAKVQMANFLGWTPRDEASRRGYNDIVRFLVTQSWNTSNKMSKQN